MKYQRKNKLAFNFHLFINLYWQLPNTTRNSLHEWINQAQVKFKYHSESDIRLFTISLIAFRIAIQLTLTLQCDGDRSEYLPSFKTEIQKTKLLRETRELEKFQTGRKFQWKNAGRLFFLALPPRIVSIQQKIFTCAKLSSCYESRIKFHWNKISHWCFKFIAMKMNFYGSQNGESERINVLNFKENFLRWYPALLT